MTPTIDRDDLIAAAEALVAADGELNEQEVKMLRILIESIEESEETSFSLNETEAIFRSITESDGETSFEETSFIQNFIEANFDNHSENREEDNVIDATNSTSATEGLNLVSTDELEIDGDPHIWVRNLDLHYGSAQTLFEVSVPIEKNAVTALIGPSGCGKSTLLRCLNRMNDLIPICKIDGEISFEGEDIQRRTTDLVTLRRRIGMVFQKPNPFPKSVYDNVAYGVRLHYKPSRRRLNEIVENSLKRAAIWEEVSDRLHELGTSLSGGQQQRLCIARTIAVEPDIILMDEPCSALDPIATAKIEELILELKKHFTVVIVTHSMSQAQRVSDYTGFMYLGRMAEFGKTEQIFSNPNNELTRRYISCLLYTSPSPRD